MKRKVIKIIINFKLKKKFLLIYIFSIGFDYTYEIIAIGKFNDTRDPDQVLELNKNFCSIVIMC